MCSFWAHAQTVDSVSITFKSGDNTLHGLVKLPTGKMKSPLIVFLPGSGESSYATNYKRFIAATIELYFGNELAILNFDKPGIGKSTGAWHKEDFYRQADNAIQAVRFAKKNFSIDTKNVFIVGHSQGGWLAQIAASKYPDEIKGAISLAGPATSVFEQDVQTYMSQYRCQGFDSITSFQKAIMRTYTEYANPVGDTSQNKDQLHSRIIKGFEPWNVIQNIQTNFLFVFAENDELVYAEKSVDVISKIFNGTVHKNIQTAIIPGTNHGFRVVSKCYNGSTKHLPFSIQLGTVLKEWLYTHLK